MYKWWFSVGPVAAFYAAFGQGTGPVYLNSMGCTGTESSLLSCSHSGIGVAYCSHSSDAGVVCPSCKLHVYTSALQCNCNSVYLVVKHVLLMMKLPLTYKYLFAIKHWFACSQCTVLNKAHAECTSLLDTHFCMCLTMCEYSITDPLFAEEYEPHTCTKSLSMYS